MSRPVRRTAASLVALVLLAGAVPAAAARPASGLAALSAARPGPTGARAPAPRPAPTDARTPTALDVPGLAAGGPVEQVRAPGVLVLGHPGSAALLAQVARDTSAALPRVTAVWGRGWARRVVVVVPDSAAELARLVPGAGALTEVAALSTGDRVLLEPQQYRRLSPVGRRVVLTHELTHVASRAATGPTTPVWLVEGLADHVGYLGEGVPVVDAAAELLDDVRAGHVPTALPLDSAFDGDGAAAAYEQGWLAVEELVRAHGQAALLQVYRAVGAGVPLDAALHRVGWSEAALTRSWVAALRALE